MPESYGFIFLKSEVLSRAISLITLLHCWLSCPLSDLPKIESIAISLFGIMIGIDEK